MDIMQSRFKHIMLYCACVVLFLSCAKNDSPPAPNRWKSSHIEYYLNKEANILTETVVRETFATWEKATHFTFTYKGRNRAGLHRDGKNTISFLLRWPAELPIGQVAYCKRWYDREGNIVESDIIFNMQLTRFTTLRTNKPDSYYIEGVLSHEIGHMIGLEHIDNPQSLMKAQSDIKESYFKGNIDPHTLEAYKKLYQIQ